MSEPIAPSSRAARILAMIAPMALAVLVGLPGANGTFVRDDWVYVPLHPLVAGEASVRQVLASPFDADHNAGLYRPLTTLSYVANWRASGETPWPYHATNLAIAATLAGLLASLLLGFGLTPLWAGLGAALFAVHPARSEAVLWIAGRSELLMTAFALLALVIAHRARGLLRWPLAALAAVLSALSKEQGFVLVLLVPILPGLSRRERVAGLFSVGGALAAAFAWRWHVLGGIGPEGGVQVLSGATRLDLLTFGLHHLGRYVRLLFWPLPLVNEYDDPVAPVGPLWVSVGVVALALPAILFLLRRPRAAFAAALFVIPLVPVLNVVYRTGETFAERFLCLPLAGFAMLVALACAGLPVRARGVAGSLAAAAVLVLAALFLVRARDWTSQRTLVLAQLRDAPGVGGSWQLVAADLLDELGVADPPAPEDVARAGVLLTRALEISPSRAATAVTLAKVHLRAAHGMAAGDPAREPKLRESERLFRAALDADPALRQARGALGLVLLDLGRRADAEQMMRAELARHPDDYRAASNLAVLLDEDKRSDEGRAVREAALGAALATAEAHPEWSGALCIAARFARDLGRKDEARTLALRALRVTGEGPELRARATIEAAGILGALGAPDDARAAVRAAREDLARTGEMTPARALAIASLDQALGEKARARATLEAVLPSARGASERRIRSALAGLP